MNGVGGCRRLFWCFCVLALRFGESDAWRPLRKEQAQRGGSSGVCGLDLPLLCVCPRDWRSGPFPQLP